jgi:hypothetical protein
MEAALEHLRWLPWDGRFEAASEVVAGAGDTPMEQSS